jgi:hypothetical protein
MKSSSLLVNHVAVNRLVFVFLFPFFWFSCPEVEEKEMGELVEEGTNRCVFLYELMWLHRVSLVNA